MAKQIRWAVEPPCKHKEWTEGCEDCKRFEKAFEDQTHAYYHKVGAFMLDLLNEGEERTQLKDKAMMQAIIQLAASCAVSGGLRASVYVGSAMEAYEAAERAQVKEQIDELVTRIMPVGGNA